MTPPLITLLSDFGLKDSYVAQMKAVISTISPEARMIDISHSIEKFNIRMGAFVLASATSYFPKGTIHIAVIDPGVGTKRRALLVETKNAFYIGPDNGLLMLATQGEGIHRVYAITNQKLMLPKVSFTFHGRDVFAPAAAHLANGTRASNFGPEISDYAVPKFVKPVWKDGELRGEILHFDDFGNIITNVTSKDLEKTGIKLKEWISTRLKNKSQRIRFCLAYGDAAPNAVLALIGSHGFLEIAVYQGNASKRFKSEVGDMVAFSPRNV